MRDSKDSRTADLLASPGARRQSSYAARQREKGLKQVSFWLSDSDHEAVKAFIDRLRDFDASGVSDD